MLRLSVAALAFCLAGCASCKPEFVPVFNPIPASQGVDPGRALISSVESVTVVKCTF